MKFISKTEAQNWCKSKGIPLDERNLPQIDKNKLGSFKIPKDSGQKIAMARGHFEHFRSEKEILIWITEWGIWPSSERMHIFERLRTSYGEKRNLKEAPGNIFNQAEFEDALSLLTLATIFFWDCYVLNGKGDKMIFYSHDEYVLIKNV
jgi:hypothetical protein